MWKAYEYFANHPPTHVLVAAYLEYKPPEVRRPKPKDGKLPDLSMDYAKAASCGMRTKTFDNLPEHIQEWLLDTTPGLKEQIAKRTAELVLGNKTDA